MADFPIPPLPNHRHQPQSVVLEEFTDQSRLDVAVPKPGGRDQRRGVDELAWRDSAHRLRRLPLDRQDGVDCSLDSLLGCSRIIDDGLLKRYLRIQLVNVSLDPRSPLGLSSRQRALGVGQAVFQTLKLPGWRFHPGKMLPQSGNRKLEGSSEIDVLTGPKLKRKLGVFVQQQRNYRLLIS